MTSFCLQFFLCLPPRTRIVHDRPRRTYRHHRKRLYDAPKFAAQLRATPIFVPPSPPPPEPDLPLALIPLPPAEEPLEPLPLIPYRPRYIPPPPTPLHCQVIPDSELVPYPEPLFHREPVPYPEPIPYRELIPYPEPFAYPGLIPYCEPHTVHNTIYNYLPTMVDMYGGYLRQDDIRVAVEVAVEMIIRELRAPDWSDWDFRLGGFRGYGLGSGDRRLGEVEIEEYIRRMNLVVQIANSSVTLRMYNAEIHPKIADNGNDAGRFPTGFERPRRLEEFYLMDSSTLDNILRSYGLPQGTLGFNLGHSFRAMGSYNESDGVRDDKVKSLLQFLGVDVRDDGPLGSSLRVMEMRNYGRRSLR